MMLLFREKHPRTRLLEKGTQKVKLQPGPRNPGQLPDLVGWNLRNTRQSILYPLWTGYGLLASFSLGLPGSDVRLPDSTLLGNLELVPDMPWIYLLRNHETILFSLCSSREKPYFSLSIAGLWGLRAGCDLWDYFFCPSSNLLVTSLWGDAFKRPIFCSYLELYKCGHYTICYHLVIILHWISDSSTFCPSFLLSGSPAKGLAGT